MLFATLFNIETSEWEERLAAAAILDDISPADLGIEPIGLERIKEIFELATSLGKETARILAIELLGEGQNADSKP